MTQLEVRRRLVLLMLLLLLNLTGGLHRQLGIGFLVLERLLLVRLLNNFGLCGLGRNLEKFLLKLLLDLLLRLLLRGGCDLGLEGTFVGGGLFRFFLLLGVELLGDDINFRLR